MTCTCGVAMDGRGLCADCDTPSADDVAMYAKFNVDFEAFKRRIEGYLGEAPPYP